MTKIVSHTVLIKQWSYKIFKTELNAHYLIFWTRIYNFLFVWVICTNYASDIMLNFYILVLSSIFIFFRSPHFEFPENVMQSNK